MNKIIFIVIAFSLYVRALEVDLKDRTLRNDTAYITSQCYTKTEHEDGSLSNPCYSCHRKNKEPNYTFDDDDLQESYAFPSSALTNPWTNLFLDRTKEVEAVSDEEILRYVQEDNYKKNGKIVLQERLNNLPKSWDANGNGTWDGYTPDAYFNFDEEGFDRAPDGSYTGWRAFAYYPFLGTFWPTNGSTDDVLIRLAKEFRQNTKGEFDKEVYHLNLLIVEALIKQKDIQIQATDERKYGVDLNQNARLDVAKKIVFAWKRPQYDAKSFKLTNFSMSYVGKAKESLKANKYLIAPGLYPKNTEFLHSVRYIDVTKEGKIKMASRMKELRYAKKHFWYTYFQLFNGGMEEVKEQDALPDAITRYIGDIERGLNNKAGWYYQGFIEDKSGALRPQSFEETLFCMGCHSNLGATADSTFVFQRKFEKNSFKDGWYHWSEKGLKGVKDFVLSNSQSEYARYLKHNRAGDEFRANKEVLEKFFHKDGSLKKGEIKKLKKDISYLLLPSAKRALELNKAYRVIVKEQSYIYGRDAHIKPAANVHKKVSDNQSTKLKKME